MSIVIKTQSAKLSYLGRGIIKASIKEGCVLNEALAIENYIAVKNLIGNKKHACIIDKSAERVKESEDAFLFNISDNVCKNRVASAYVVKSPVTKLINNLRIKLKRKESCVRYFTDEKEALNWVEFRISEHL